MLFFSYVARVSYRDSSPIPTGEHSYHQTGFDISYGETDSLE